MSGKNNMLHRDKTELVKAVERNREKAELVEALKRTNEVMNEAANRLLDMRAYEGFVGEDVVTRHIENEALLDRIEGRYGSMKISGGRQ